MPVYFDPVTGSREVEDPIIEDRRRRQREAQERYDRLYNESEARARSRGVDHFAVPDGNPSLGFVGTVADALNLNTSDPVRPLNEVPWRASMEEAARESARAELEGHRGLSSQAASGALAATQDKAMASEIEQALASRRATHPLGPEAIDAMAERIVANTPTPPSPSRVAVTIDGRTYDYANGGGGAPVLADPDGMVRGLGREQTANRSGDIVAGDPNAWRPAAGGGTVSVMDTPHTRRQMWMAEMEEILAAREKAKLEAEMIAQTETSRARAADPYAPERARADIDVDRESRIAQARAEAARTGERDVLDRLLADEEAYDERAARDLAELRASPQYARRPPQERAMAEERVMAQHRAAKRQRLIQAIGLATGRLTMRMDPADGTGG